MKSKLISIIFTAAVLSLVESCFAQGFTNLDFEHAKIAAGPGGFGILTSNAIPGWTAYIGGTPQSVIFNDGVTLGGAMVSLQDTNAVFVGPAIQGNFSVLLSGGGSTYNPPSDQFSASIGQTGTIPTTAKTLTFWGNVGGMQLTFNGQPISFIDISNTLNYAIWVADISAYAGQAGQLLFTTPVNTGALLDNIQFSSIPVPEPSMFALTSLGALFLGFCRRRR